MPQRKPKAKVPAKRPSAPDAGGVYRGKLAKTGNSLGFRIESALFQSHPEFRGDVEARVIAPGRLLLIAEPQNGAKRSAEDPVLASFLSFLAADMARSPEHIRPLDDALYARIDRLVKRVRVEDDEDLGEEACLE